MKIKTIKYLLFTLVMTCTLTACSQKQESLISVGSTALQPLVEEASVHYADKNHVRINVQGGGSGTGLNQVQAGTVTIGNSDIFAQQADGINANKLIDHRVAVVGIVPVINKKIGITNISMLQLREIFSGKINNWNQLGGPNQKIVVVNRAEGSGTRKTFELEVMKGQKMKLSQTQDSNGSVQKIISTTPGSISYLAFPYANKKKLQKLSINHVKPTSANVLTNKWVLWSYEHMYMNKKKQPQAAKKFIGYIMSRQFQTSTVEKMGYISIRKMKVQKDANGKVTLIKNKG